MISIALCLASMSVANAPEKFLASSESYGYVGTVTVYRTLSDARASRNPLRTVPVPQRDGAIYSSRHMGGEYGEFNAVLTNWYSTTDTDPTHHGYGNPNNKNEGFFQMYDENASNWQNQKSFWNRQKTVFYVEAKGKNATYDSVENPGDYARFWNAGAPAGSGEATKGRYLEYAYNLAAAGLTAVYDNTEGVWKNTGNASSFTGSFSGIFQNTSERHPESNGYYVVALSFNSTSWARSGGLAKPDVFKSSTAR